MPTYDLIASANVSNVNTYTFSSIPQTYTDLILNVFWTGNGASSVSPGNLRINGVTGTSYTSFIGQFQNTSVGTFSLSTSSASIPVIVGGTNVSSVSGAAAIIIQNYTSTSLKTILNRTNALSPNGQTAAGIGRYGIGVDIANTAAVTSLTLMNQGTTGRFGTGSLAQLYGILAA
jgi:hypothetical protein